MDSKKANGCKTLMYFLPLLLFLLTFELTSIEIKILHYKFYIIFISFTYFSSGDAILVRFLIRLIILFWIITKKKFKNTYTVVKLELCAPDAIQMEIFPPQ
jgi:hypothetical protein